MYPVLGWLCLIFFVALWLWNHNYDAKRAAEFLAKQKAKQDEADRNAAKFGVKASKVHVPSWRDRKYDDE